jgi:methyl-accepting chemotaxis protein
MSIRSKILAGFLALTMLTALLGGFGQVAERELGALALRIYDDAFMAVSYLRSAQVEFAGLAASLHGTPPEAGATRAVLDDLDVARERAMSQAGRAQVEALQGHVAAMLARAEEAPNIAEIAAIQAEFERVVETFADDGFRYRRNVGELVAAQVRRTSVAVVGSLLAALAVTALVSGLIAPPVRRAVRVAQAIAAGRLDNPIAASGRGETADLLRALSTMQDSIAGQIGRIQALLGEQARVHGDQSARQAEMDELVDQFATGLGEVFRGVSSSAGRMAGVAGDLGAAASEIDGQGRIVDDEMRRTGICLDELVASSQDLTYASYGIRDEAARSEDCAGGALRDAEEAAQRMVRLRDAADEIGSVAGLIGEIADQTNLLALNAAIEASRAGVAGRGFAVVAAEVKRLAQRSGAAAEDVKHRIARIQDATSQTAGDIGTIRATVTEMHGISTAIARAVAVQDAASARINAAVGEVAASVGTVRASVVEARRLTDEGGAQAREVGAAAQALSAEAARMGEEVAELLEVLRSMKGGNPIGSHRVNLPARSPGTREVALAR